MAIKERTIGTCKNCGKEFERKRISKMFCSDTCRKAHNRAKHAQETVIEDNLNMAIQAIEILAECLQSRDTSLEAALALDTIYQAIDMHKTHNGSQWHCTNCLKIITANLPLENDCDCKNPQWILQKTML